MKVLDVLKKKATEALDLVVDSWKKYIFTKVLRCGTGELGETVFLCDECQKVVVVPNSCTSRNCPSCGKKHRANWVEKVSKKLLPIKHFHMVFTIPHELNYLFVIHSVTFLSILVKSVHQTIDTFFMNKYNGKAAYISVLHTWDQTLKLHYHIHVCIAAAYFKEDRLHHINSKFLFPVKQLSEVFRGIFLDKMIKETKRKESPIFKIGTPDTPKKWNVYCGSTYNGVKTCIKYFGTYANRPGISDQRILNMNEDNVEIAYKRDKNEKDPNKQTMQNKKYFTISILEFVLRFIQHILPKGFHKIRYGGLYASRSKALETCREQIEKNKYEDITLISLENENTCPKCGAKLRFLKRTKDNSFPLTALYCIGPP
jgi:predicted RNA-binding Zn-ribbon protein involved in translation (DUF1610 family)